MTKQNIRLFAILPAVGLLLFIPFISMQISRDPKWSRFDFILMGVLLSGTLFMLELIVRRVKKFEHRIAFAGVVLAAIFLIWAELAVGVFGTPFAGN